MSAYPENLLTVRFAALAPEPLEGDWLDVQRRARGNRRRRMLVLAAAAVLAVLVVGSALAVGPRVIDFFTIDYFSAAPAPPRVVDFLSADRPVRQYLDPSMPEYDPAAARTIFAGAFVGGRVELDATPIAGGGFCLVQRERLPMSRGVGGTCQTPRTLERQPLGVTEPEGRSYGPQGQQTGASSAIGWIGRKAERLELRYEDGSTDDVPFFWVTPPIGAGFFLFDIPGDQEHSGHRAQELVAFDAAGVPIARRSFLPYEDRDPDWDFVPPYGPPEQFPRAADSSRIRVLDLPRSAGRLELAPARDGASCFLLHHPDASVAGCLRDADDWKKWRIRKWSFLNPTKGMFTVPTPPANASGPALFGIVDPGVARVELIFQDGEREYVRPNERFLLYQTRPDHFALGTRLAEASLLDAGGRIVRRVTFAPETRGIYPCRDPRTFRKGLAICP